MYRVKLKNGDTQRCFDCVDYNCSSDIKETCSRYYETGDILKTCFIRTGKPCKYFRKGIDL